MRSMSRKGCCPDNARAEGFFGTLKEEFCNGRDWSRVGFDEFWEAARRLHRMVRERQAQGVRRGLPQDIRHHSRAAEAPRLYRVGGPSYCRTPTCAHRAKMLAKQEKGLRRRPLINRKPGRDFPKPRRIRESTFSDIVTGNDAANQLVRFHWALEPTLLEARPTKSDGFLPDAPARRAFTLPRAVSGRNRRDIWRMSAMRACVYR